VLALVAPGEEADLAGVPGLSVGIMSATQGVYRRTQLLLDITQGARAAYSSYDPPYPPPLSLAPPGSGGSVAVAPLGTARGRAAMAVEPWGAVLTRAARAPQILQPGLLAGSIPGGAAYAGVAGSDDEDGVVAADRAGRIAAFSSGSAASLPARITALANRERLVVADLPAGAAGLGQLRALSAARAPSELLIVVQRAARPGHELLWVALGGLGGGRALSSQTTEQRGLIDATDLAPTILRHLGVAVPAAMNGRPLRTDGALDDAGLRALKARLEVIHSRRLPALACLLGAWALLLLALSGSRGGRALALRVGGLALLWSPVASLITAALAPSAAVEYAAVTLACLVLAVLTDALIPWPRAPLAPALAAVVALTADALAGTQLLVRSLLGPSPALGARFYGIGNELKSGLAVLVFAAVAAALYPAVRGRRAAAAMALAGIALAVVEGSARIGAGVGGVILVCAGTAVATVMLLPGDFDRRRALIVLLSPIAGLVALAALDLATAHGSGHFTGSVLHARSAGDVRDIIVRRYGAAWSELKNHAMPAATALALAASALAVRRRERLLAPVGGDPAWLAALAGGLTAGVAGMLSEDSGPLLLVVAVFALGCVLSYLWGRPSPWPATAPTRRSPGSAHGARSRARTPQEELAR